MAADNTAKKEKEPGKPLGQRPIIFVAMALFNLAILVGVAVMLYMHKQETDGKATLTEVLDWELKTQKVESDKSESFIGHLIPLETFLVNLAGGSGKIAKINMEFEVNNSVVQDEIDKRKPQIRDIIIILLSSKGYKQVSTREGKDILRDEIRDTVNSFLTKGKIKRVYFTEFILN